MTPPKLRRGKMAFRTGMHNPFAIYGGPVDEAGRRGPLETPLGFIADERAARLAADMMTEGACLACPWGCEECSLSNATCECYTHQDDHPGDDSIPPAHLGAMTVALQVAPMASIGSRGMLERPPASELAVDLLAALAAQGWRLIHD